MEKTLEIIRQKSTRMLTENDKIFLRKNGIMNGCGGQNRGFLQKILLKFLTPVFFEASCDLHDFGYWKGWDEERRAECDRKFYEKILEDIENFSKNFFEKNFYKILAKIFYIAVRLGGKKYFNYK